MDLEQIRQSIELEARQMLLAGVNATAAGFFDGVQSEVIERAHTGLTVNE